MKSNWLDDIVELIEMFKGDEEIRLHDFYKRADFKISKEQVLELLIMGVQAGYIEALRDEDTNRYCVTSKGRNYASMWYL